MNNVAIKKFVRKNNLKNQQYEIYFNKFLKLNGSFNEKKQGKLIVVTSINPTPAGEGKTTLLIGLVDAMNHHKLNTIGTLRQPSLGPVFGLKGGATGGGMSRLKFEQDINIHFTGDFHAITTANNLISAIIENEIYFNSELNIDPSKIFWKRCIDANDRGLRNINININNDISYETSFNITAASDLMSLFCLVNNKQEFINELNKTIVAFSKDDKPITISSLNITDAIIAILNQSFKPNVAFSEFDSPFLIHGGPFANIAHGCNSLVATNTALNLADYVVTECGFGSDLGFEKLMNIKLQKAKMFPDLVILCVTIKALMHHGQLQDVENKKISDGFNNLLAHVNHIKQYGLNPLIILNINSQDNIKQINHFKKLCKQHNLIFELSDIYNKGPKVKTKKLVNHIIKLTKSNKNINYLYDVNKNSLREKIDIICKKVYQANQINISDKVQKILDKEDLQNFYICISKTQYSLSSNPELINKPKDIVINISDYEINYASKMIILLTGNIIRMPGLNKNPRAKNFKQ